MDRTWTIYGLRNPGEVVIRYVGQTSRPLHERLRGHLKDTFSPRLAAWFSDLASRGQQPEIIQLATASDQFSARDVERDWIGSLSVVFGSQLLNFDHRGDFVLLWDLKQSAVLAARAVRKERIIEKYDRLRAYRAAHPPKSPRRYRFNGLDMSISDWAKRVGVSRERMRQRIDKCEKHGVCFSEALTTPPGETMPSFTDVKPWSRTKASA